MFTVRCELIAYFTQAVNRLPLTADPRTRAQVGPHEGYCGQSGVGTGVCPGTWGFLCQHLYTDAPYSFMSPTLYNLSS